MKIHNNTIHALGILYGAAYRRHATEDARLLRSLHSLLRKEYKANFHGSE